MIGVRSQPRRFANGVDESGFLDALVEIVEAHERPAEGKLALFHGAWQGNIDRVFSEFAY